MSGVRVPHGPPKHLLGSVPIGLIRKHPSRAVPPRLHRAGVLPSKNLTANSMAFDDGVARVRSDITLGGGCHLVLVRRLLMLVLNGFEPAFTPLTLEIRKKSLIRREYPNCRYGYPEIRKPSSDSGNSPRLGRTRLLPSGPPDGALDVQKTRLAPLVRWSMKLWWR